MRADFPLIRRGRAWGWRIGVNEIQAGGVVGTRKAASRARIGGGTTSMVGDRLTAAAGTIRGGGSTASRGVGVRRGQRAQEGGPPTRAIGIASTTNSGRGSRPLETLMNCSGLFALTTIIAHQLVKTPRGGGFRPRKESGRRSAMSNGLRDARPSRERRFFSIGEARRGRRSSNTGSLEGV